MLKWVFTYDGDGVRVIEDYFNGTTNVISLYFAGGMYEVTDPGGANTITRYYGIAGQRVAMYDANGNMTCRVEAVGAGTATWIYDYNDANRLWKIRKVSGSCGTPGSDLLRWVFTYDGDGQRVQEEYYC